MGRGATQVWWSWRRTIWTLWGLLAVSAATSAACPAVNACVAVHTGGPSTESACFAGPRSGLHRASYPHLRRALQGALPWTARTAI